MTSRSTPCRLIPVACTTVEALEGRRMLAVMPAYADKIGLSGKIDPTPTFVDDFNGSSLDASKWQIREGARWRPSPSSPDSQFAWTHPSAVKVANGEVQLVAHNDSATGQLRSAWIQTAARFEGQPKPGQPTPKLVSGRSASFEQKYGYWEARLKFDTVSGMWGAFWVHSYKMVDVLSIPENDNRPDKFGTEMDVAESAAVRNGASVKDEVSTVIHASGYEKYHRAASTHTNVTNATGSSPASYHVYGLMWTDKSVSFYLDGKMVHRETDPELVSKVPHMAILSTEIGAPGSNDRYTGRETFGKVPAGGYGSLATSKAKLTADYVRVWKLTGTASPTPAPTPTPTPAPVKGAISGTVFNDANINGQKNAGEAGLGGRTVYVDTNNNGKLDTTEKRTTTSSAGGYVLGGLAGGTYIVRQVLPSNARQSAPTTTAAQTVKLAANGSATLHFATWTVPAATPSSATSTFTGSVYIDNNKNGIRDGQDTAIANVIVYIDANDNGKRDASERLVRTASNGGYRFDKLKAGKTVFRLDLAGTAYTQTFPLDNAARRTNVLAATNYGNMNFRARRR